MSSKYTVVVMEAPGGSDKGPDGHRKDTMPIVEAIKSSGVNSRQMFYTDESRDAVFKELLDSKTTAVMSRINPGTLSNEKMYFDMLRELYDRHGLLLMPHPDAMVGYGAKDALVKLNDTPLVPRDTAAYYSLAELKANFPKTIMKGERVLKQNRGSTGEGIWRVQLVENIGGTADEAGMESKIKCTEAKDNHVEFWTMAGFMDFCDQYLVGDGGQLVDMTFLPRIKEGEMRVLMIYKKPVQVVHKKPASEADAFSATLFSGAKYTYMTPEESPAICKLVTDSLDMIQKKLGGYDFPILWTCDFILDTAPDGKDAYILGEMNCSCVGITYDLEKLPLVVGKAVAEIVNREMAVSA
eukprot:CAMPEP_0184671358 /NCGR_PEP_ID=MMETSP0308-20130426/85445_1 /TAXON_ID=38269 /ORGANISM="Gloeochaete witrockiana, Strain SAG 46.84" /LENGTH=353 /DNA_ID=CAMNT_0027118459 /DNA_START=117 /DNA_END=1178 /DNA_ORIENTATION=+